MTPEIGLEKREQMIRDGFCVIDNILTEEFLQQLREESERLIAGNVQSEKQIYHGHYISVSGDENEHIQKLLAWQPSRNVLEAIGFGDFTALGGIIILTKDPGAPSLFWHQDWYHWDDPISCTPWPQQIFLNYYLTDTTLENGCLKVIPGTHCKRIDFHDILVQKHEILGERFQSAEEDYPFMFNNHPDQVDVCVNAGSLILTDARLLHAARKNYTDKRRTLLLAWYHRPNTIPDYWDNEIPVPVTNRDQNAEYPQSNVPEKFLKR